MARTSDKEVKDIINTQVDVSPFIRTANAFVTEKLGGLGLSDGILREIETWLTAHLVAVRDQDAGAVAQERVGETSVRYTGTFGEGLLSTRYGQTAAMLDPSGTLRSLAKPPAQFRVIEGPSGVSGV